METQKIILDQKSIDALIREGRGKGHGSDYKPWIFAQSVSVNSHKHRWLGKTTGREHHFLSNLEHEIGSICDWSEEVTDIREQFPLLPITETIEIASDLGIAHPSMRKKHQKVKYIVMTTDLVLDVRKDQSTILVARAIKPHGKLSDSRTLQKLEIERRYWERREIDWGIITDLDYNRTMARNIADTLRHYQTLEGRIELHATEIESLAHHLTDRVRTRDESLIKIIRDFEIEQGFPSGRGLDLAWYLIANRRWIVDLTQKLEPHKKIHLIETR